MIAGLVALIRSSRAAQFLLVAGTVLLILIAVLWLQHRYVLTRQAEAVALDRADTSAEVAARVLAAERLATAAQAQADAAFRNAQQELVHEVEEKGSDDAAGPAVTGVLARMREQQAAGRR